MAHHRLLAALWIGFGLAACGAGETSIPTQTTGAQQPAPNPNQPRFNSDQARLNPDQPAPNPDQPGRNPDQPGGGAPGGGGLATCAMFCQHALNCLGVAGGGLVEEFLGECMGECGDAFQRCPSESAALAACALASPIECSFEEGDFEWEAPGCAAQYAAFEACEDGPPSNPGGNPPGGDPPGGGDDCTAPSCVCDEDPCLSCNCLLGASSEVCILLCDG